MTAEHDHRRLLAAAGDRSSRRSTQRTKDQLVARSPSGGGRYIALNTTIKPFDDINVRKAVIAGLRPRRAAARRAAASSSATSPTHLIPPGHAGFEEAGGLKGPGVDFRRSRRANTALSAEYFKKAGYPSGKYDGRRDAPDGRPPTRASRTRRPRSRRSNFEKMGFKVRLRLVSQTPCTRRFCNVAAGEGRDLPERRLAQGLRRRSDDARPDVQRQEHPPAGQLQLAAAQRPEDQQGDGQGRGADRPEGARRRRGATIDKMVTEQAPGRPVAVGQAAADRSPPTSTAS